MELAKLVKLAMTDSEKTLRGREISGISKISENSYERQSKDWKR